MIAHLRGQIAHSSADHVVIDVNGVGYAVQVPAPLATMCEVGREITLSTHMAVREGEMSLYGFGTPQEREIFRLLIAISSVGPKLALKVLSALSPAALATAILEGDVGTLTRISGVGQKTAKRLLLELSEKIGALAPGLEGVGQPGHEEAEAVLVSLGCTRQEAKAVVREARDAVGDDATVEHLVMAALKVLGTR